MIEVSEKDINVLKDAIVKYGAKAQLRQLQEECAELIAAINHCFRGRENASMEFLEEFVDVYVVMFQLYIAAKSPLDFYQMFEIKMARLKERLSKEVNDD